MTVKKKIERIRQSESKSNCLHNFVLYSHYEQTLCVILFNLFILRKKEIKTYVNNKA